MRGRPPHRLHDAGGFTLLELIAAITIFGFMSVMALVSMQNSTDQALDSVRARELRLLAERKMGEIQVFEAEFDEILDNRNFDSYGDELYDGWEWSLFIRDVVIFGTTNDEAAEYLFGAPANNDDENTDPAGTDPNANGDQEQEGETQYLRELTLTVTAPREDGGGGGSDSVTIVTFVPLVESGPAGSGGGATGGAGGGAGNNGNSNGNNGGTGGN